MRLDEHLLGAMREMPNADDPKARYTEWLIEINSLEELLELARQCDNPLIVDAKNMDIEIYDTWRE
jgi:hypothetical protein